MADVYPLQPVYGLTKKVEVKTTAQNVDISEWNVQAYGFTQILVTNTADNMIYLRIDNHTVDAQVYKDLPIIAGAPITISRNQSDKNISIISATAGGFVWLTPIQGD